MMLNINYELLLVFVALNVANVIIQTIKSICTIKCGKGVASLVNAVAYGLYTIVIVYTVCDLPLYLKAIIVAVANLVGVFIVKWIEEKKRKDRLWKVEVSVLGKYTEAVRMDLASIPNSYIENLGKYTLFNFYCDTQKQTKQVKDICSQYGGKFFATESQNL